MADNSITLIGNLTRDPELRFTTGGRPHASFGLAVNRRYQVNGEWTETVSFFNVVAWGELAENAAASFTKGNRAIVNGRLEQRTWEKDGEKHSTVELVADDIGASARWARLEIRRVLREQSSSTSTNRPSSPPPGPSSADRAPDPIYGEEPF